MISVRVILIGDKLTGGRFINMAAKKQFEKFVLSEKPGPDKNLSEAEKDLIELLAGQYLRAGLRADTRLKVKG